MSAASPASCAAWARFPWAQDEIAADGVPANPAVAIWWRQDKPQVLGQLLQQHYQVVLAPRLPCYFDFVQDESQRDGRRQPRINDLARVYGFPDQAMAGLIPAGHESQVLGIEACVWTELIQDRARLDYMIFPRLAALAEDGWSAGGHKDVADFRRRLPYFLRELDRRHVPYFDPSDPGRTPEPRGPQSPAGGAAK